MATFEQIVQISPEWPHTTYAELASRLRDIAQAPSLSLYAGHLADAAAAIEELYLGTCGSDGKRYAAAEPSPPG